MYLSTLAQPATEEGLTWSKVVADLPTDPASVFTLALLVISVSMVLWAGRSRPGGGGDVPPAPTA